MASKIIKSEYIEKQPEMLKINPENVQDEFLYGKSIEALDYSKQIRNKPTTMTLTALTIPTGAGAGKVWTSDANGVGSWV